MEQLNALIDVTLIFLQNSTQGNWAVIARGKILYNMMVPYLNDMFAQCVDETLHLDDDYLDDIGSAAAGMDTILRFLILPKHNLSNYNKLLRLSTHYTVQFLFTEDSGIF